MHWILKTLSPGRKWPRRQIDHSLLSGDKLRMHGAIFALQQHEKRETGGEKKRQAVRIEENKEPKESTENVH
jgi:hypothetical protein